MKGGKEQLFTALKFSDTKFLFNNCVSSCSRKSNVVVKLYSDLCHRCCKNDFLSTILRVDIKISIHASTDKDTQAREVKSSAL